MENILEIIYPMGINYLSYMTERLPLDFDVNDGILQGNYDTAIEIPERIEKGEKRSTARYVGVAGPTIN